ncbi:MAG: hypothetical protein PHH54_02420, partial [Candidatus Nanoarchaeia archaeon]|nr:hypothetical protein [Candidatus Nanoarchaeia archaeon]
GLSLDGSANLTMTLNSSLTGAGYTNSSMIEGSHTALITCNNTAGNYSSDSINFSTNFLQLTLTSPLTTQMTNITDFNVSANENMSWCGLSLDGSANLTMTLNSSLTGAGYTNSSMIEGSHTALITCNNTYGSYISLSVAFSTAVTVCANLTRENAVYTLYNNLSTTGDCFVISANNITLNLNGYTIDGDDSGSDQGITANGCNYTFIRNGTITDFRHAIYLTYSSNNLVDNMVIDSNSYGTLLESSLNNVFANSSFTNSTSNEVWLTLSSTNNTFLNVSYTISKESVSGSLIRKWYYRAYVNDTLGDAVSNANVTAYNRTGDYNFNLTTNVSGWTSQTEIIDYVNTGSRSYYSPYTIFAINSSYQIINHNYNATYNKNNLKDMFSLDNITLQVTINSPTATTYTTSSILFNATLNENGTCLFSVDSGATNYTISTSDNLNFNYTKSLGDGSYTAKFYCNDTFGNRNDTSNVSFSVDTYISSVTSSSNGGLPTYTINEESLSDGYTRSLGENWKLNFNVNNKSHELKVESIDDEGKTTLIIISSEKQEKLMSVGEEWKINLDNESYYDFYVKLNNITSNRASLTLKSINELIETGNEEGNIDVNGDAGKQIINGKTESFFGKYRILVLAILIIGIIALAFMVLKIRRMRIDRIIQRDLRYFKLR